MADHLPAVDGTVAQFGPNVTRVLVFSVGSKLKCPFLVASEMSGLG